MNLTKIILTDAEKKVLSKGLKFCSVRSKKVPHITKCLFEEFATTVKKEYFVNSRKKPGEPPAPRLPFILKSDWEPPEHKIADDLIAELEYMEQTIDNICMVTKEKNLTKKQYMAIKQLAENRDNLIIREADKGSAVVLQSREDYI